MASVPPPPFELELTITSAKDLKNVNWRHGDLKPYAVVWVDPSFKCSTQVDDNGDTCPIWDEKLVLPLLSPIEESTLYIDIVHANAAEDTKPLIGSARVPLREILDDYGIGAVAEQSLQLKRPSGRPQGRLQAKIVIRDTRYRAPPPAGQYYPPPYGVPPPPQPPVYGGYRDTYYTPYGQPAPVAPPPGGYPYGGPAYGQGGMGEEKKGGKMGFGTGVAVGAVAGALGGIALVEGAEYLEEKIEDDVAAKVEEDLAYDDDFGGDDF